MAGARVHDVVEEDLDQRGDAAAQKGVGPGAEEVGVGLQQVEMGVHAAGLVLVHLAEAHVGQSGPVAEEGLVVAAAALVGRVVLHQPLDADGLGEALGIAGRAVVLAERVDGERLGVDVLAVVQRRAGGRHRPEDAAVERIEEVGAEVVHGVLGHLEVGLLAKDAVGGGERPQDTGVEHRAPRRVRVALPLPPTRPTNPPRSSSRSAAQKGRMPRRSSSSRRSRSVCRVASGLIVRSRPGRRGCA